MGRCHAPRSPLPKGEAAGIRIQGETEGLVLERNTIRDTREGTAQTQKVGVLMEKHVREVTLRDNQIDAGNTIDDQREKNPTLLRKE